MWPQLCTASAPAWINQPELLFLLREIDHLELIAEALDTAPVAHVKKSRAKKTIAASDLADVFGIEMAETEPAH